MNIFENIKDYFQTLDYNVDTVSDDFFITRFSDFITEETIKVHEDFANPHKRGFFEISVIIHNSDIMNIGEKSFENISSSLIAVSPFQVVSFNNLTAPIEGELPQKKIDGYLIFFKPSFFASMSQPYEIQNEFPYFKIHTSPIYHLTKEQLRELVSLCHGMYTELQNKQMHKTEIIRSLLLIILYQIKRITFDNKGVLLTNRQEAITAKFEQIIISNNGTFFSVNEYASQMNISAVYLSECVKKTTGKSAQKVIIDYKILYAQSLLQQTDRSISEIANEMNFPESTNFTKFFKRNTGKTPKQFRKDRA